MSDEITKTVHKTDINGCHVTVEKLDFERRGEVQYAATVSYKLNNASGVHVASPVLKNIGSAEETKSFITREVNRASREEG